MKIAKDYSKAIPVYFKPEISFCPHCSTTLKRSHVKWRKNIFTFKGIFYITSLAYKCSNNQCPHSQDTYCSAEAETLSIKYYQFSIEVIAKIGYHRFKNHKTEQQIQQTLKKEGLNICLSEVSLLCQAYLALATASRQHDPSLKEKLLLNGGIVLSLDAIQPEKGNETVWILRDVTTGEVLLAKNLQSSDKESIASLLKEVKALDVPMKAVVSDGQQSIRLAVEQVFPGVPHQLCHFHFLRNIAKPVADMDRALKVDLKKRVRGVKQIKLQAQATLSREVVDQEAEKTVEYCDIISCCLQDDGIYPLKPGGLMLYERLRKTKRSILRRNKKHPSVYYERLQRKLTVVDDYLKQYRRVRRLYELVFEAAKILGQEATASKVKADMTAYVERLRTLSGSLRFRGEEEQEAIRSIVHFTENWWEGLFSCYGCEEIPRTNNDLERSINGLKRLNRKTTGCRSCQSFIVRYGAYVVVLDFDICQDEVLMRLCSVGYGEFRVGFGKIREFRGRVSLRRLVRSDLNGLLRRLESD